MDLKKLEDNLSELIAEEGYNLYSCAYSKGKSESVLALVVDREDPISLNDLEALSGKVSDLLDRLDPIDEAYTLDISSLGAEKPIAIEDIPKNVGRYANIHLSHPYKGLNSLEGYLRESETPGHIVLEYKEKNRTLKADLEIKDIDKARRAVEI